MTNKAGRVRKCINNNPDYAISVKDIDWTLIFFDGYVIAA